MAASSTVSIAATAPGKPCAPEARARRFALVTVGPASALRRPVEAFIAKRFEEAYGARIDHFLPTLVALLDRTGRVVAAAGFAAAAEGPLFLERYLDAPIESVMADAANHSIERPSIVEIGNLAARTPGGARYMASALAARLVEMGFEWAVFTATLQVRNALARCGLAGYDFGPADGRAMGENLAAWGSYYDNDPRLVGGSLGMAASILAGASVEQAGPSLPC